MSNENQDQLNEKLFDAIRSEDIPNGANQALAEGADINALTDKNSNALIIALNKNKRKSFAWLIKNGINVDNQDNQGETVLMKLCKEDKKDYLDYLLNNSNPNLDLETKLGVTALQFASTNSNEDVVKKLVAKGADVNKKTLFKASPLLSAAQQHNAEIFKTILSANGNVHDVDSLTQNILMNLISKPSAGLKKKEVEDISTIYDLLIENGLDINYKSSSGNNALFAALLYGHKEICKKMIENDKIDLDFRHNRMLDLNLNPLHLVLERGDVELADLIITKLKDNDPTLLSKLLNEKNSKKNTPGAYGYILPDTRQLMLDNKVDVNSVFYENDQPIPVVCSVIQGNDENILDAMISQGVKLHFEEKEFEKTQPIKIALMMGLPNTVEKIIKNSSIDLNESLYINEKFKTTPLNCIINGFNSSDINAILVRKAQINRLLNQKLDDGTNAHHLSDETRASLEAELEKFKNLEKEIAEKKSMIVELLLDNGSKLNAYDEMGKTSIFYCKDVEMLKLLIEKGADIFMTDKKGNTPLAWAIKNNNKEVIQGLLEHIIENDLVDKVSNLLIEIAYTGDLGYVAEGLLLNGLNVAVKEGSGLLNNVDEDGNTALIVSAATEQLSLAQFLIEKGADVNIANNLGETALIHAIAHGNEKMVDLLIKKGADLNQVMTNGKTVFDCLTDLGNKDITELVEKKKVLKFK